MGMTKHERKEFLDRPEVAAAVARLVAKHQDQMAGDILLWASIAFPGEKNTTAEQKRMDMDQIVSRAIEVSAISKPAAEQVSKWHMWPELVQDALTEWFRILDNDMYEYYISICITQESMHRLLRSGMNMSEMSPEDKGRTVKLHHDAVMGVGSVIAKKKEVARELFANDETAAAVRRGGAMAISPEGRIG